MAGGIGGWDQDESRLVQMLQEATLGTIAETMGITVTVVRRDRIEGSMPVEGNRQPMGLLHGGASCVLAESLASLGSALHGWPDKTAMGIEINATHHRSATEGQVHAVATPLHLGRTVASWNVAISDDQERLICTARVTCVLR